MFSLQQLTGIHLPDKTLCFTFDDGPGETSGDGPGPKTVRLAQYLRGENIKATFFCTGMHIDQFPEILSELDRLGHFVGNHTYSHPRLPDLFNNGQTNECLTEITTTDTLIRKIIPDKPIYFRAPYGQWLPEISIFLNKEFEQAQRYIGPFYWDTSGYDFAFWDRHQTAEECAAAYLADIERANHGMILMHDSTTDIENMRLNNRTFETVKILVPFLKEKGYKFVGIDHLYSTLQ